MGNRLKEGLCLACGTPLLFPFNEYRMCSVCTPKLKKVLYETKMKRFARKNSTTFNKMEMPVMAPKGKLGVDA